MAVTARKIENQVAEAQEWLGRQRENVSDAYDATRRTVRRGLKSAEEFSDEARYQIKHHPFRAAAISLGLGVGVGLLVGWSVNHRRRSWFR